MSQTQRVLVAVHSSGIQPLSSVPPCERNHDILHRRQVDMLFGKKSDTEAIWKYRAQWCEL
jgi:hypothetical protein